MRNQILNSLSNLFNLIHGKVENQTNLGLSDSKLQFSTLDSNNILLREVRLFSSKL